MPYPAGFYLAFLRRRTLSLALERCVSDVLPAFSLQDRYAVNILENGSHYRASEVIPLIVGVLKNKIERRGRQNKNNRPINLPKVITFSTDYKYTT